MSKGEDRLTRTEDEMLAMLFSLVREYEQRAYPRKKSTPPRCLNF